MSLVARAALFLVFAGSAPLSAAQSGPPSGHDDAARLVPADAAIVVRLASVRGWNELQGALAPLLGDDGPALDLQRALDGLAQQPSDAASLPRLDPERPLYLAVSLDPATGPALTFVAPTTNDKPFRLGQGFGATTSVVLGSYSAVSSLAGFAAGAEPSALLAALRPGLVSVHVDLASLIAAFRPMLDMGLRQAQAMLDQAPAEGPFDVRPMMEVYLEGASALLDSARSLDLVLDRQGDELAARVVLEERVERVPAADRPDPSTLLGHLDPASSIQVVFNGRWSEMLEPFEGLVDAVLAAYPEPLRADLGRILALSRELDPWMEPGLAAGFDFGSEGPRGAYALRSSRPAELVAKLEELVRVLDHEGGFLGVGAAERLQLDGLEARVLPLAIRYEALWPMLAGAAGEGQPDAATRQQLEEALATVYGRNPRLALAHAGETVLACLGNDEAELRAGLARLRTPVAPPARIARLAQRIEPGALGFAYHLDFGQALSQLFATLGAALPGTAPVLPPTEASLDTWGSVRGGSWSGGMAMNLAELVELVRAVQLLEVK